MSVQAKYQEVLDLGQAFQATDGKVEEANGVLKVWGTVKTQGQKDALWDKIKAIGGQAPGDIQADIKVSGESLSHEVVSGDTLGKIAKTYLGSAAKYKEIAEFNNISNPDLIKVGQVIRIP
ncbi:MAG: LysM peptidoglycan-binding domain-containing protein [Bacteroidetes Order II. Incertae sedis bacterium]|nr:LysM peptidoglycan-binding domain-containing protein [Bacteroidetes Order II. bacterium]